MQGAFAAYDIVCSFPFQQRHHRHESRVQVCRGYHFKSLACDPRVLVMHLLLSTGQQLCSLDQNICVVALLSLTDSYATSLSPE